MSMNCPFCDAPYTKEMLEAYETTYGCETGCPYVRIEIRCSKCNKTLYVKGDFGSIDSEEERKNYLDEIEDAELIEAIRKKIEGDR